MEVHQAATAATSQPNSSTDLATAHRFVTIAQASDLRPAFTEPALRDIRFKAFDRLDSRGNLIKGNGSGEFGCWIVLGGKVLLDLERFDAWVVSHTARAKS